MDAFIKPHNLIRLWNVLPVAATTRQAAAVRISDEEARTELHNLVRTLTRQQADNPIGAALRSLGQHITEETPQGERDRQAAGLVPVHLSDLDDRAPHRLLAYVGVVHDVLIMLIPSSGIEANLPPHRGDRTHAPRNGAIELILEAVATLPELAELAVPRMDRLLRRAAYIGPVLDALRYHRVKLCTDKGQIDLSDTSQMTMAGLEASIKGDADAIDRKTNILGGRINAVSPTAGGYSGRDFNWQQCPPGYGPVWVTRGESRVPEKGSIEVKHHQAAAIKAMWTHFGDGATLRAIGDTLADHRWQLRDGSGRTADQLTAEQRIRLAAKMVTREIADLHRSGTWTVHRGTSAPVERAGGMSLEPLDSTRRGVTISGRLPVPLIDGHSWGISDHVWDKVAQRHRSQATKTAADHGRNHGASALQTTAAFLTDGGWHRFEPVRTTLQLRRLTAVTTGDIPTWSHAASTLVAACNQATAVNLLGQELMRQLAAAPDGQQPLDLPGGAENQAARALRQRLIQCRAEHADALQDAAQAGQLATLAHKDGNGAAATAQLTAQNAHLLRASQLLADADQFQQDLDRALADGLPAQVDLRQPIGVAAAMIRWTGDPDPVLRSALRTLGIAASLRGRHNLHTGTISVYATATIKLLDGTETRLPIRCELPNTSRDREVDDDAPGLITAWADGRAIDDLAASRRRSRTWVRHTLAAWLRTRGVDQMSTALLDCPIPVTRQAVVATLDPELVDLPAGLSAATLALLTAPYLDGHGGRWKSWTGHQHDADRRLLAALSAAGGEADVAVLRVAAGADPARLHKPFGKRPRLATAPQPARRRLLECPHPDCPSRWADHVLYTPETAAYGVICSTCRRLPDLTLADAPLPDAYLEHWDRTRDGRHYTTRMAGPPVLPHPDLAADAAQLIRPVEIAKILGVTIGTVGDLRRRGELSEPVTCDDTPLWRRPEIAALRTRRARSRGAYAIKDGWLSPADTAARLGVPEHRVREYCADGLLAYKPIGRGPNRRIRIHPDVVAAFRPALGDLLIALTIVEAAAKVGRTAHALTKAARDGRLPLVQTSRGRPRVLPADLAAWNHAHPHLAAPATTPTTDQGCRSSDGRLSVSAAAARLGISAKTLRRLADAGHIDDHRPDGTGWRWFTPADIDRLTEHLADTRP